MPQLMQNNADEVQSSCGRIGIKTIVPNNRERAGRADGAIKNCVDVTDIRKHVKPGKTIRQRLRIPCIWQWSPSKVPMRGIRTSLSESGRCIGARQRIKIGVDSYFYRAREKVSPHVCSKLKSYQPLVAQCDCTIPAGTGSRIRWAWVIKSFARTVKIDDGHRRRLCRFETEKKW